jgi:hypothetical protein
LGSIEIADQASTGRPAGRREEMAQGTLEVLLVGAKGLENTDYLSTRAFGRSSLLQILTPVSRFMIIWFGS